MPGMFSSRQATVTGYTITLPPTVNAHTAPFPVQSSQFHHPLLERGEIVTGCNYVDISLGTGHEMLVPGNSKNSKGKVDI